MKQLKLVLSLYLFFPFFLAAQTETPSDTTIYNIVEEMPRFPGCEQYDTTAEAKVKCAEANLLAFFYKNIQYPLEARQNGNQGTVVLGFVVERDGFISNPYIIKDIGGGCGAEALRIASGMNSALADAKLRWRPGIKNGNPVRMQYTLPLKFKLEEPLDYVLVGTDSVYVAVDDSLTYKGGHEALMELVNAKLKYPTGYEDSCHIGYMDVKILVQRDEVVKVLDINDYFNLGFDFQFEVIQAASATVGNWNIATRKGRKVPTVYDFSIEFTPQAAHCKQRVSEYERANILVEEGSSLFNEGKQELGIEKLTEAIELFPKNANFLYMRGQAYLNLERLEEACEDFKIVREVLSTGFVDNIIPLICK